MDIKQQSPNSQRIKEEMTTEIIEHSEMSENENTI